MKIELREQEFLELIAVCIDFPCSHIERFDCTSRNIYKIIEKLLDAGYIKKFKKHLLISLRITQKGLNYLANQNSNRFNNKKKYCKSDKSKRLRVHRIAEAYMLFRNAGVNIYKDEKPDFFTNTEVIAEENAPQICSPCFYSSLEMKNQSDEYVRIKATRAVGIMLIDNKQGFFIYNIAYLNMKWCSHAERKLEGVITGTLLNQYIYIKKWAAIMIGVDEYSALQLLRSDGGLYDAYFRLDNTYDEFYYIPDSLDGELIVKILCNSEIRREIRKSILEKFELDNRDLPYANDGIRADNKVILLAYEFDMEKIKSFNLGIQMFHDEAEVICFDFQKDTLEDYFEGRAEIKTIDSEMVARKWFGGK